MTQTPSAPLALVQMGRLAQLQCPALLPYDAKRPWLQLSSVSSHAEAAALCEGIALQLLAQHAIDTARLLLFEATPSPYFSHIKRLLAASDARWGEQLFTARACLSQLTQLEELVHRRFSLLAQAGVADIQAYNQQVARPETVIYLLLNGLGHQLSESKGLQTLEILCRQGAVVGIVPLLLYQPDEEIALHRVESRREAMQSFFQLTYSFCNGLEMTTEQVKPINLLDGLWALLQRFDLNVGLSDVCTAWCDDLMAKSQQEDAQGEQDFLQIPIGLAGATPVNFSMGEQSDVYHALIGGATRTGKTTLLNNLILKACEAYTPEQLQLTLMDFKDGVSFWEYEGLGYVADLYAPLEDDFDTAITCLQNVAQQIQSRNALFRRQRVTRLSDYNQASKQPLPRCLLVIDEVQSLFEGRDYKQKAQVKPLISMIAKKGAAAGLHMILSTQSFQNVELEGDVRDQFHLRIGLRHASSMGCRALMGRDNDAMLTLPRFSAVYNRHQGEAKHNRIVVLDDLPDFLTRLDRLKLKYPKDISENSTTPPTETVVIKSQKKVIKNQFYNGDVSEEW